MMNPIDEALERLRKDGWARGALINEKGERCIRGALCNSIIKEDGRHSFDKWYDSSLIEIENLILKIAQEQYPYDSIFTMPQFNDDVVEDFEAVEKILEKASQRYDDML